MKVLLKIFGNALYILSWFVACLYVWGLACDHVGCSSDGQVALGLILWVFAASLLVSLIVHVFQRITGAKTYKEFLDFFDDNF